MTFESINHVWFWLFVGFAASWVLRQVIWHWHKTAAPDIRYRYISTPVKDEMRTISTVGKVDDKFVHVVVRYHLPEDIHFKDGTIPTEIPSLFIDGKEVLFRNNFTVWSRYLQNREVTDLHDSFNQTTGDW